jgi:hypothetical protein
VEAILAASFVIVFVVLALRARQELRERRRDASIHAIVQTFGAAQAAAQHDPRQLLVWHPLAEANRALFPDAFAALDKAMGRRFPFSKETVEEAHAKWTADWLAWEKAHDEEYRLKTTATEQEMARVSGDAAALARARLDRIQHEKLERYQQRYEEYIRTAKALRALLQ